MKRRPITLGEMIVARIDRRGSCWIWNGNYMAEGYPAIMSTTKTYYVIPELWEHFYGPVPEGMVLSCTHVRAGTEYCVNPAHYLPRPNVRNPKVVCRAGHDLTNPEVVWTSPSTGRRFCLACARQ